MKSTATNNGRHPGLDPGFDDWFDRLLAVGQIETPEFDSGPDMPGEENSNSPLHNERRHPEDPHGALMQAAMEVCDPELVRAYATQIGTTSQAVDPESFMHWLYEYLMGASLVREGAYLIPAKAAAGEQMEIVTMTKDDVAAILADGKADITRAERLVNNTIPRINEEISDAEADVETKQEKYQEATEEVDGLRPDEAPEPKKREGGLFAWVQIDGLKAMIIALIELVVTTAMLEPPISGLIDTSIPYGSLLIAAGLAAVLLVAFGVAGYSLAAMRLPSRLVGALFITAFGLLMWKFVIGLDALRAGDESGVQALTAATLAAGWVSAVTGYSLTTWKYAREMRESLVAPGTRLGDAIAVQAAALAELTAAKERLATATAALMDMWQTVDDLHDASARSDSKAARREAEGKRAEVKIATIDATTKEQVAQERASHMRWAFGLAVLAYLKARAEELPTGAAIRTAATPAVQTVEKGLSGLQWAAIAAFAVGAVGGAFYGPIPLAIGTAVAALLLLADRFSKRRAASRKAKEEAAAKSAPPLDPVASSDDPMYVPQPDHMVAKYRSSAPDSGEHN